MTGNVTNRIISMINVCKLILIGVMIWVVPPHVGGLFVVYVALDFMVEYIHGGKRIARRHNNRHNEHDK